jgi:hypothetical protein
LLDTVVAAQKMHAADADWDPMSLALYIQASILFWRRRETRYNPRFPVLNI